MTLNGSEWLQHCQVVKPCFTNIFIIMMSENVQVLLAREGESIPTRPTKQYGAGDSELPENYVQSHLHGIM